MTLMQEVKCCEKKAPPIQNYCNKSLQVNWEQQKEGVWLVLAF